MLLAEILYTAELQQFFKALQHVHLPPGVADYPNRELSVNFPVEMDDRSPQTFTGYRVHHNTTPGLSEGGIRYHRTVGLDETRALATWIRQKSAIMGIPYGGPRGCVIGGSLQLSVRRLENLTPGYATAIQVPMNP